MEKKSYYISAALLLSFICFKTSSFGQTITDDKNDVAQYLLPNIGCDWNTLYAKDDDLTMDSAKDWVLTHQFIHPTITYKCMIDACGKYFFRYSDGQLLKILDSFIYKQFIPYSPGEIIRIDSLAKKVLNNWASRISIHDQIWNDECIFFIPSNLTFAYTGREDYQYIQKITSLQTQTDTLRMQNIILHFDEVFNEILMLKDEKLKLDLLFSLLLKTYTLNAAPKYLTDISMKILGICSNSIKLSPIQKATFVLGCAKLLATYSPLYLGSIIYSLLNNAKGYVGLNENDTIYSRQLRIIEFNYLNIVENTDFYQRGIQALTDSSLYFGIKKFHLSPVEKFKNFILISSIYQKQGITSILKNEPVSDYALLKQACYLLSGISMVDQVYENSSLCKKYISKLYESCGDYFELRMDYTKALYCYYCFVNQAINNDDIFELGKVQGVYEKIHGTYRNLGVTTKGKAVLEYLGIQTDINTPILNVPADTRLWNDGVMTSLVNVLKDFVNEEHRTYSKLPELLIETTHDVKRLYALKIALYESKRENWKEAYLYLAKSDSFNAQIEQRKEFYTFMLDAGSSHFYPVIKMNDEKEILGLKTTVRERLIAIVGISIILIGSLISIFFITRERKRALEAKEIAQNEGAKATMLANTLQQICHNLPDGISQVVNKYKQKVPFPIQKSLRRLITLLKKFYVYSRKEFKILNEEVKIVNTYLDILYEDSMAGRPSLKIKGNIEDFKEIIVPAHIFFNAICNAFEHGDLMNEGSADEVEVTIEKSVGHYHFTIINTLNPYDPSPDKIIQGTGFEYMKEILRWWNGVNSEDSFLPFKEDGKFYLKYSFINKDHVFNSNH